MHVYYTTKTFLSENKKHNKVKYLRVICITNWSMVRQACNILFLPEDVFSEAELLFLQGKIRICDIGMHKSFQLPISYHIFCRGGLLLCFLPQPEEPPPPAGRNDWMPSWAMCWTSLVCRPQSLWDCSAGSLSALHSPPPAAGLCYTTLQSGSALGP